jgi:ParB-like chromosome segregation protein Spo0J
MLIKQDLALTKIIDHPINASIYRDNFDDELVESVKANGVLNPIIVCKHAGGSYVCLSGHRRRQAAKLAGLTEVPCLMYREDLPEWQQVLIIVESNRQRAKTTEMLARETEALAKAKEQEAAARKKAGKKASDDLRLNLAAGQKKGRAIDQAAEQTGIGSRMTAEKAIDVVHKIDELEAAGQTEAAEELRETLNEKSVSAAHRKAKDPEPEPVSDDAVLDAFKTPVPDELAEVFASREEYREVLNLLTTVKKRLNEILKGPGGRWLSKTEVDTNLADLRRCVDFGQPHTECGMCQRDAKKRASCDACKHRGYVNQMAFGNQSAEAKVWLESR